MTTAYKYSRLIAADEIRVLDILPTAHQITCRLRHVTYTDGGYYAMSYVWGNPQQLHLARVVDEQGEFLGTIPLTQNLQNALCSLRDLEEMSNKSFWIDQICINQLDNEEKSHQVGMMGQIYSYAEKVITHVGIAESEDEQRSGVQLLERLAQQYPKEHDVFERMHRAGQLKAAADALEGDADQLGQLSSDLMVDSERNPEFELSQRYVEQGWRWLLEVAFGEWTQRLWIVQEQILNSKSSLLQGVRLIDWETLVRIVLLFGVDVLPQAHWDRFRHSKVRVWGKTSRKVNLRSLFEMWNVRRIKAKGDDNEVSKSLLYNLIANYRLQCHDVRDRVYALLAISNDVDALCIRPNYLKTNTPERLSIQLTVALLKLERFQQSCLELLPTACLWRRSTTLPSWSLNLDLPQDALSPISLAYNTWAAHPKKTLTTPPLLDEDTLTLTLRGRVIDKISVTTPLVHWPRTWEEYSVADEATILAFAQFLLNISNLVGSGVTIDRVASLGRTLASMTHWCPPVHTVLSDPEHMVYHFWWYLRVRCHHLESMAEYYDVDIATKLERCERVISEICSLLPAEYADVEVTMYFELDDEEYLAWKRFEDNILKQGRSLCISVAGRYCNVMHQAEVGDAVVAFESVDRLYVVRAVGQKYRLIGDVYVDGLMFGEAYAELKSEDVDCDIRLV